MIADASSAFSRVRNPLRKSAKIQLQLQNIQSGVDGEYDDFLLFWVDKPIGDPDLIDALLMGHSGVCSGVLELLHTIEKIDITRE